MTPLYKISLGKSTYGEFWAKLESRNPTGSHKDRSLPVWIAHYLAKGINNFCISSSGNSALSAANFCDKSNLKLYVFVRPNIDKQKLAILKQSRSTILKFTPTPKRDAIQFSKMHGAINLRASTDDIALVGYREITQELLRQLPRIHNIFVPTSSGATLEGMYEEFRVQKVEMPAFYAIQTTRVHPIASNFETNFHSESESLATAIVDNIAHRKNSLIRIIKKTGGGGYIISNSELEATRKILRAAQIYKPRPLDAKELFGINPTESGWQSVLAMAGFLRWGRQKSNSIKNNSISVCLFTD